MIILYITQYLLSLRCPILRVIVCYKVYSYIYILYSLLADPLSHSKMSQTNPDTHTSTHTHTHTHAHTHMHAL